MKVTKLDPAYEVHHMSVSDEHDKPLYFDNEGNQIPMIEVEMPYKPEWDTEEDRLNGKTRIDLYRDVHHKVGTVRSRSKVLAYIKMLVLFYYDKWIGVHVSPTDFISKEKK